MFFIGEPFLNVNFYLQSVTLSDILVVLCSMPKDEAQLYAANELYVLFTCATHYFCV